MHIADDFDRSLRQRRGFKVCSSSECAATAPKGVTSANRVADFAPCSILSYPT